MASKLTHFMLKQSWVKVLRALHQAMAPRSLRELAELTGLPLASLQDVIRRLEADSIVKKERYKNRILISLDIGEDESELLRELFRELTKNDLRLRAEKLSTESVPRLQWIDSTMDMIRAAKEGRVESSPTTRSSS